jgi:hypothetical protein
MLSANQLYRESGSTLPFREWIEREKSKGVFIPNVKAQEEFNNADGGDEVEPTQQIKQNLEVGSIIGKNLLFVGVLVIGGLLIYRMYKKGAN